MKILASFVATIALALGALVAVPSTATAAYPGTVATATGYGAPASVKKNRNYIVALQVRASAGNARPAGTLSVYVYRVKKGKYSLVRLVRVSYAGSGAVLKSLGKFAKKGNYATKVAFLPASGSVYKSSVTSLRSFKVR